MLSVLASPSCKFPSAVIVPVACKFPNTSVSPNTFKLPVPLGRISKSLFVSVIRSSLSVISKSSINNLLLYTAAPAPARLKKILSDVLARVLPLSVNVPTVTELDTSTFCVLAVPTTCKGWLGLLVLTPTRPLITSKNNRSVSNARLIPSRTRLFCNISPVILPTAIVFIHYAIFILRSFPK